MCCGKFDNCKTQAAGIGQRGIDDLSGFFASVLNGNACGFQRIAPQNRQPAFDLSAILGAGDDFLSRIAAFFEMYAADDMLVEPLGNGSFFGCRRNPSVAAADFVQIPSVFGCRVIFGQKPGFADFQTT